MLRAQKESLVPAFGKHFNDAVKQWSRVCHPFLVALACAELQPFDRQLDCHRTHVVLYHLAYNEMPSFVKLTRYEVKSVSDAAQSAETDLSVLSALFEKPIPNRLVWTVFVFICQHKFSKHVRFLPQSVREDRIDLLSEFTGLSEQDIGMRLRAAEASLR